MMNRDYYMSRSWLCDRLRLSPRQSRALVPSAYGPCVSYNAVLALVNRSRRNAPCFGAVPSDLVTAAELASSPELASSGLTPSMLLGLTRRESPLNQPPHLRINKQTTRFPKAQFLGWLDERARAARKTGRTRYL